MSIVKFIQELCHTGLPVKHIEHACSGEAECRCSKGRLQIVLIHFAGEKMPLRRRGCPLGLRSAFSEKSAQANSFILLRAFAHREALGAPEI